MDDENTLIAWTVTHSPRDYPGLFIARKTLITDGAVIPTPTFYAATTLDAVRQQIPQGLVRFERQEGDDPVIVETWL